MRTSAYVHVQTSRLTIKPPHSWPQVIMFWSENIDHVLNLVEGLAVNMRDECNKHTPGLLALLLTGLRGEWDAVHHATRCLTSLVVHCHE